MKYSNKHNKIKCMETVEQTIFDYCKDISLHNNHILICVEGGVSSLQLTTLASEKGNANSNVVDNFFKEMAKAPKILVSISDKAFETNPNLKVGDLVMLNDYGNPRAIFVEEDPFELDNIIDNYKIDRKDPKFAANTIGFQYKVRCYYTYEASAIILTKKQ